MVLWFSALRSWGRLMVTIPTGPSAWVRMNSNDTGDPSFSPSILGLTRQSDSAARPVIQAVGRVVVAAWLSLVLFLLAGVGAGASLEPFRTVIGPVAPAISGLKVAGGPRRGALYPLHHKRPDGLLVGDR